MSRSILRWTVLVVVLSTALTRAAEPVERDNIAEARTALQEWVKTKGVISAERQEWTLGREILLERIKLIEEEIASLREKIDETQGSVGQADDERAGLVEENETLKASSERLAEIVTSLEAQTIALDRMLPDRARDSIESLTQQLSNDPNETKLSLSQRFLNELAILEMLNKFDRTIELASERRQLADGSEAEVTAMYVGLGQTYYTGANATVGGVGRPGPDGWRWEPANAAADEVEKAVAILNNEDVAGFVPLPVTVEQGTKHGK